MRAAAWSRLLLILLCLLPLVILFLLPGGHMMGGMLGFWMLMLLTLMVVWMLLGVPADSMARPRERQPLTGDELPPVISEVMQVHVATEQDGVTIIRGPLLESPETAYEKIQQSLGDGAVPLLRDDPEFGSAIVMLPQHVERAEMERTSSPAVNWLLFVLTMLTTTWAGAAPQGVNLLEEPDRFAVGLPYAIGLMAILGVHELGHFFTARYHGIHVTPPFFIPVPFALGTFGAFIQMKSPTQTRTALFDVAVAGPLAGLVIAIPALLIGLQNSAVVTGGMEFEHQMLISHQGTSMGSSVLLALIAKVALPEALDTGCTVRLSPLAFAGWLGLIVTALNLLPIGQLDGGHIARAMFGSRVGGTIGTIAMWTLFLLALFVWPALMMWAIIVFFIAGRGVPPLNDITPISFGRRLLGYFALAILLLILTPVTHSLMNEMGIYCPYV